MNSVEFQGICRRGGHSVWFASLILAILVACSPKTAQVEPKSAASEGQKPVVVDSGFFTAAANQVDGQIINAKKFVDGALFITRDWAGHPDWKYVDVQRNSIIMSAHQPRDNQQTTVRSLLAPGVYRLTGLALLRYESQFPVVLSAMIVGEPPFFSQTFVPVQALHIDQGFRITGQSKPLELQLKMAPGATNSYCATLTISGFRLQKVS